VLVRAGPCDIAPRASSRTHGDITQSLARGAAVAARRRRCATAAVAAAAAPPVAARGGGGDWSLAMRSVALSCTCARIFAHHRARAVTSPSRALAARRLRRSRGGGSSSSSITQ